MPKKKLDSMEGHLAFRVTKEMQERVVACALLLDIDYAALLRMMLREKLPEYEERAEKTKRKEDAEKPSSQTADTDC